MSNKPTIPTKTSDLTNDSGFIDGLEILSYGNSTWNDFITAYQKNKVVYCRASSNSNPASGSQTRLAFMAYVNNATSPTEVEFQYYRSVSSHSDSQQGDQVFVYKLTSAGNWTVTTRNAFSKVVAGTGLSSSYSNGAITLSANAQTETDPVFSASAASGITSNDITSWNNKSNFSGSYNDLTNKPTIPDELADLSDDSTHRVVTDTEKSTWNSKQAALVSGTNIKTVNNESLLGSGNISISSGVTSYNDLTDKPFYDATYLLRAVGSSLTQEKFEELGDAIQSNTVIKIDDSIVFAIYDIKPQIVISWINYDQFFMIKILGDYDNHPVTYEYNGEKLTLAIDGDFIIQSIDSTITNEQYQTLVDGLFMEKCVIVEGAIGHISFKEKDNVIYLVISYLTDNVLNEIWISDTTNNHQVTMEQIQLTTTTDLVAKQDTLVSGTNIKTINGDSILGSGNLDILNMVYPVGSIYMSVNSTSPATLFGGTWEAISQGRTLVGVGTGTDINGDTMTWTAEATGGEYLHTLTIDEMPSHSHVSWIHGNVNPTSHSVSKDYFTYAGWGSSYHDTWENTGGGQAHNNLQPFFAVYMWKRTA